MTQDSKSPTPFKFPAWAQVLAGLVLLVLVYWAGVSSTSYLSDWDLEDSNFFEPAIQGLQMAGINPTAPTALIFWENQCEPCKSSLIALQSNSVQLRVHGIHILENSADKLKIRKMWQKLAPRGSQLTIDKTEILQTSFQVKAVPEVFIYLPKQKKFYSYLGDISKSKERMLEIIKSEY